MTTRRLSPADAIWFRGENARNPMTISSILWFDRPMDVDRLRRIVEERLLDRHPVFRERIVPSLNPMWMPRWEEDRGFDLSRHIEVVDLPAPGDHAELERRCSVQRSTPLDRARPLWKAHVFQGYRGTASAMHVRIHHSLGDGLALMRLLLSLADEHGPDQMPLAEPAGMHLARDLVARAERAVAHASRLAFHPDEIARTARLGADVARWSGRLLTPDLVPDSILLGRPSGTKRMAWNPDGLPLDAVKEAAHAAGATVNDVLLAVLTGALHDYLTERDALVDEAVVYMPVNLRPPDEPLPRVLGNRIGLLPIRLPVGLPDPASRLAELRERIGVLKRSPAPPLSRSLMMLTTYGTPTTERAVHRLNQLRSTGVVTNVPGPAEPIHLAGARILGTVGWGGMTGHLNAGVSFVSLTGRIFYGLVTDEAVTPDPERILAHVQQSWEHFLAPAVA